MPKKTNLNSRQGETKKTGVRMKAKMEVETPRAESLIILTLTGLRKIPGLSSLIISPLSWVWPNVWRVWKWVRAIGPSVIRGRESAQKRLFVKIILNQG